MTCHECDWPIISTIRGEYICPQCYHKQRGLLRPPTPENTSRDKFTITLRLSWDDYNTLEQIVSRMGYNSTRAYLADRVQAMIDAERERYPAVTYPTKEEYTDAAA